MVQIASFHPVERIVVDAARYDEIRRHQGIAGAEAHYMGSVEEISDRLAEIDWGLRGPLEGEARREMAYQARSVAALGREIGLMSLAAVALDLGTALVASDEVALRAIWQRLVRVGDRSLTAIWEVPGLSM